MRFEWGKKDAKQRVQAAFTRESRDYTATNPYDFYHYGRSDTLTSWAFSWRRSLPHDLAIEVALTDDGNRSHFAQEPPTSTLAADQTAYDTTLISAGVSWRRTITPGASRHGVGAH